MTEKKKAKKPAAKKPKAPRKPALDELGSADDLGVELPVEEEEDEEADDLPEDEASSDDVGATSSEEAVAEDDEDAPKAKKKSAKADAKAPPPKGGGDPVTVIGAALDRLVKAKRPNTNHASEVAHQDATKMLAGLSRKANLFKALDKAIEEKPKRAIMMVHVLCDLLDADGAIARVQDELELLDSDGRWQLAQAMGQRKDPKFLPILDKLALRDPDANVRSQAFQSISQADVALVAQSAAFKSLLPEPQPERRWTALWGVRRGGFPQARPFLRRTFEDPATQEESKVVAAWGLANLGEADALAFLGTMLEAKGLVALRAAQAICDVKKWPFTWGVEQLPVVKERWAKENG